MRVRCRSIENQDRMLWSSLSATPVWPAVSLTRMPLIRSNKAGPMAGTPSSAMLNHSTSTKMRNEAAFCLFSSPSASPFDDSTSRIANSSASAFSRTYSKLVLGLVKFITKNIVQIVPVGGRAWIPDQANKRNRFRHWILQLRTSHRALPSYFRPPFH